MTQTAQATTTTTGTQAPVASSSLVPTPAGQQAALPPAPTVARHDTPKVLSRWRGFVVLLMLISMAFTALALLGAHENLRSAQAAIGQGEDLRRIESSLAKAEASATVAFLDPKTGANDMKTFNTTMDYVSRQLIQAAASTPTQATVLGDVSTQTLAYRQAVQVAWDQQVAGNAAAPKNLLTADQTMRTGAMAALDSLIQESDAKAAADLTNPLARPATVMGWITAGFLLLAMIGVARRTHHVLNPGLALALALQLVSVLIGGQLVATTTATMSTVNNSTSPQARLAIEAQREAYRAQAEEALQVLNVGGADSQQRYQTSVATVTSSLASLGVPATGFWSTRVASHSNITAEKVRAAGGTKALTDQTVAQIEPVAYGLTENTRSNLASARNPLLAVMVLVVACGILGPVAASAGIGRRLQEYR